MPKNKVSKNIQAGRMQTFVVHHKNKARWHITLLNNDIKKKKKDGVMLVWIKEQQIPTILDEKWCATGFPTTGNNLWGRRRPWVPIKQPEKNRGRNYLAVTFCHLKFSLLVTSVLSWLLLLCPYIIAYPGVFLVG